MNLTKGASDAHDNGTNSHWQLYLPYLSALVALALASNIFWNYHRLSSFRGSSRAAVSSLPHRLAMLRGESHLFYAEANNKYGPIARVAPNILTTSSPEVWAHVNNTAGYKRSDWYYNAVRIEHRRDNVFSQTDNAKHDMRRKQMAPGYSGRENAHLEDSIDECLDQFLKLLRTRYISSDEKTMPIDMGRKVQFFTLDVISKIGLGTAFGMLQADKDVDNYLQSSEEGLSIGNTALALGFSWLTHVPWLGQFIAPSPNDGSGFGKMMATCFRLVDERVAKPADERSDMLASFIRHGLAGHELRTEALEQIIAGSDTTATAIRATLLYVMTNPRVCRKLQEEADDAVRSQLVPGQAAGLITAAQARKLRYLQAVIREATRLSPPVANIFSRDVPPGGDTVIVDGQAHFIPGGTCIGYSAYAMHRSRDIYGADADVFRPERWLETDEEKLRVMTFTNELVFGHGKFRCLGQKVAQMEISKLIFETFRQLDLAIINPTQPWTSHNCLGLFQISNMWVQVTERKELF
ncbi:Cytochrome P450 [Cordyceps fumosorosea ARSEF 2679]|uniref:Cytochrome P450 monooxygenase ABA1 n=1 Tax=Cordyceps fumosorosea (strain ARSEF 2679) TaxID=1081104 RepID=A0A162K4F8_CORFA|nr:Cytochrome P450 [Cordyceps fumosorosea ARSEF 2679]OAA53198.1 Cytochrome P450 [Cordyceps fumosorosea ARSEF 2679]